MEEIIQKIENFCQKENIPHRFVGGVSFGGLLNNRTDWQIDIKKRKIKLKGNNSLELVRSDNTIKDIDIILLTIDISQKKKLQNFILEIRKTHSPFPSISIELLKEKNNFNSFFQFVTTIVVDSRNTPSLTFDTTAEKISWNSLEVWTVIINEKLQYAVRNPIADYYAYQFRSPSGVKEKDTQKILLLKKLTNDVITRGREEEREYMSNEYYLPWERYTNKLTSTKQKMIIIKKIIMNIYWKTIGTSLAHESGFFGRLFSTLSDKFTG